MHESMVGAGLAMRVLRAEVTSARPDSPVVPGRPPARTSRRLAPSTTRARASVARALVALAARVQPAERCSTTCGAGAR